MNAVAPISAETAEGFAPSAAATTLELMADSVREYLNRCVDQPAEQSELALDFENMESPNSSKSVLAGDKMTGSPKPWIGMQNIAHHGDLTCYMHGRAVRKISQLKNR